MNNYELVVIYTPVLKDDEVKQVIGQYRDLLKSNDAEIIEEDFWGMKQLAYPIQKKTTGFYNITEFKASPTLIERMELQLRRDERVLRFMTVKLDKFAIDYNDRKRKGLVGRNRKKTESNEQAPETTTPSGDNSEKAK